MDFIAKIVLGYIDIILGFYRKKQKIIDYQILRYRDDYRIFVNNTNDGKKILKLLSEIMIPFALKLNASKTKGSQDVITQSIKRINWLGSLFQKIVESAYKNSFCLLGSMVLIILILVA